MDDKNKITPEGTEHEPPRQDVPVTDAPPSEKLRRLYEESFRRHEAAYRFLAGR